MRLIVGLGNPGAEYAGTRHNAGWMVVDRMAGNRSFRTAGSVAECRGAFGGVRAALAKPLTFMNLSGAVLAPLLARHRPEEGELIVVCDDVNLPLGALRFRPGGGDGGHKGLQSVIAAAGPREVARLRVGVGRPAEETALVNHVLDPFNEDELRRLPSVIDRAVAGLYCWCRSGIEAAMSRFNGTVALSDEGEGA